MKLWLQLGLLTASLVGIAVVGPGFCLTHSTVNYSPATVSKSQVPIHDVVKVHTERGVVTLPGKADSWDAVENAIFVADSIADVQMVNNEVSFQPSFQ
jgi:BON domain